MSKIGLRLLGFLVISSCKSAEFTRDHDEKYAVINSIITAHSSKINKKVYLTKYILKNESWILKNIFNDSTGYLYNEICPKKTELKKADFGNFMQQEKILTEWNYKKIRNKSLVSEIVLNADEKERYEKSTIKDILKTDQELDTYKYILWGNPSNIPLLQVSYPFFNKDKTHALVYGSIYRQGTLLWILENEDGKWKVICSRELGIY